jgi:hypothetical protein
MPETPTPLVDAVSVVDTAFIAGGPVPVCSFYQDSQWQDGKYSCMVTPLSLLAAPGRIVGNGLKKVFPSQPANQLEIAGHILTALLLIGGTVYLFNKAGR